MIDNFYEHKVKVVCTAEVGPRDLFTAKIQTTEDSEESRILADDLSIEKVRYAHTHARTHTHTHTHTHTRMHTQSRGVKITKLVSLQVKMRYFLSKGQFQD